MRERDQSRHLAVGAGAPSDPDTTDEADEAAMPDEPCDTDDPTAEPPRGGPQASGDVVDAVAEFLDDLIDDPAFAPDPRRPADN